MFLAKSIARQQIDKRCDVQQIENQILVDVTLKNINPAGQAIDESGYVEQVDVSVLIRVARLIQRNLKLLKYEKWFQLWIINKAGEKRIVPEKLPEIWVLEIETGR